MHHHGSYWLHQDHAWLQVWWRPPDPCSRAQQAKAAVGLLHAPGTVLDPTGGTSGSTNSRWAPSPAWAPHGWPGQLLTSTQLEPIIESAARNSPRAHSNLTNGRQAGAHSDKL